MKFWMFDADWREDLHPRGKNGQFVSGSSSKASSGKKKSPSGEKPWQKEEREKNARKGSFYLTTLKDAMKKYEDKEESWGVASELATIRESLEDQADALSGTELGKKLAKGAKNRGERSKTVSESLKKSKDRIREFIKEYEKALKSDDNFRVPMDYTHVPGSDFTFGELFEHEESKGKK